VRTFRDSDAHFLAQKVAKVVHPPNEADLDLLVSRMAAGDREAVGTFLTLYGPMIRRRVRGKLRMSVRRLFDSQDILSTVGRRLDTIVRERRITAKTQGEFWSLISEVAENSVVEKGRIVEGLRVKEGEESGFASEMLAQLNAAERVAGDGGLELAFDDMLASLKSEQDRTIATLWAVGLSHAQIAEHLDSNAEHVRQRWHRIRETLRASFRNNAQ
jgi:DNA-directed RNA polymerase specialized sigma24 family protein